MEIITPADNGFCGNDIALIILEKNIPASEAQPAIPVVQFSITDERLSGSITAMGYGITSPSAEDSGQRRIRENIPLLCIPGEQVIDCSGDDGELSSTTTRSSSPKASSARATPAAAPSSRDASTTGTPVRPRRALSWSADRDKCLAAIYSRTDAHAEIIIQAG